MFSRLKYAGSFKSGKVIIAKMFRGGVHLYLPLFGRPGHDRAQFTPLYNGEHL